MKIGAIDTRVRDGWEWTREFLRFGSRLLSGQEVFGGLLFGAKVFGGLALCFRVFGSETAGL